MPTYRRRKSWLPDLNHPVVKMLALGGLLMAFFHFGYASPIEGKDVVTILGIMVGSGLFDYAKKATTDGNR